MLTRIRKWAGTSRTPRSEARTPNSTGKNKLVAFIDDTPPPPPPTGLSGENMEDWRRFREVGLLDKAALERRDREELQERTQRLEAELFDYQYNMGLLLIEKKEWTSKHEELCESLQEAQEALQREKLAHSIAASQVEEREKNLREALAAERLCVAGLERSLWEIRSQHDANNLEMQQQLLAADAKLAEANRRSSELERKLQAVETRESVIKQEHMSFASEQDSHEPVFLRNKEDMREWERELQEAEERLYQSRRENNEREELLIKFYRVLEEKESEIEEECKKTEMANLWLKKKEEEVEDLRTRLEMKEKHLTALEIRNLLNEHRPAALDIKREDFEAELEEKRKLLGEREKVQDVPSRNLDQALSDTLVNVAENVGGPSMLAEASTQTDTPGEDLTVQEVAEDAEHLEATNHRQKSSRKGEYKIHRTRSVKAVVEESAAFFGTKSGDLQLNEEQLNEESRGDSVVAEKAASTIRRKRTRSQSSKMTQSGDAYESEGRSESVTTGGRRKRRQTGAPALRSAGKSCYN